MTQEIFRDRFGIPASQPLTLLVADGSEFARSDEWLADLYDGDIAIVGDWLATLTDPHHLIVWIPHEAPDWIENGAILALEDVLSRHNIDPRRVIVIQASSNMSHLYGGDITFVDDWYQIAMTAITIPRNADPHRRRDRHFVCLNRVPKEHRLMTLAHLWQAGHWDKSYVSLSEWPLMENYWDNVADLSVGLTYLRHAAPIVCDTDNWQDDYEFMYLSSRPYIDDSYISLVTESVYYHEQIIFFTEKTWKPIIYEQPFLMIGAAHTLAELRRRGFRTFAPHLDETYDTITDPILRWQTIMREVDRLAAMSLDEMHELYEMMLPICRHNRQRFDAIDWAETSNVLRDLLRPVAGRAAGLY